MGTSEQPLGEVYRDKSVAKKDSEGSDRRVRIDLEAQVLIDDWKTAILARLMGDADAGSYTPAEYSLLVDADVRLAADDLEGAYVTDLYWHKDQYGFGRRVGGNSASRLDDEHLEARELAANCVALYLGIQKLTPHLDIQTIGSSGISFSTRTVVGVRETPIAHVH